MPKNKSPLSACRDDVEVNYEEGSREATQIDPGQWILYQALIVPANDSDAMSSNELFALRNDMKDHLNILSNISNDNPQSR